MVTLRPHPPEPMERDLQPSTANGNTERQAQGPERQVEGNKGEFTVKGDGIERKYRLFSKDAEGMKETFHAWLRKKVMKYECFLAKSN